MDDVCPGCSSKLREPYISCVVCKPQVDICLKCFSKGKEFYQHSNDHSYEVKSAKFPLFDSSKWYARDEIRLLNAIEELGFGNWKEVSKKVGSKSSEDCKQHYLKFYVDDVKPSLPKFTVNTEQCFRRPLPYKTHPHLPRPNGSTGDDTLFSVGYMPARADFHVEYDNYAECDVKEVIFNEEEDDELITELNLAVMDIYYSRLQDRKLRKKVMKDYGLLDIKNNTPFHYGRVERKLREDLRKFARLSKSDDHEKLIQSILYQKELEARILHLQEYRSHGLREFRNAHLYEKLKRRRHKNKVRCTKLDEVMLHADNPVACRIWLQRQMNGAKTNLPMPTLPLLNRKPANPLDLTDTPGLHLLTEPEKELCSTLRLLPEVYLNHRHILEKESFRSNGIKLQYARVILKIDVNKTKRLYDFCIEQGYIKSKEDS